MNAIVPVATSALVPADMDQAIRLAKAMSSSKMVPKHLQDDPGTCLMIVDQAMRWRMSPFAVAQCTSSISGKLMFEGKLVAAAVETSGAIQGMLDYQFSGEGENRTVTVSATRVGETKPREMVIKLADVRTNNEYWKKQPDQQLVYSGARNWARRWTPAVILGVYAPEEFSKEGKPAEEPIGTPTIEGTLADSTPSEAKPPEVTAPTPETPKPELSAREKINIDVPLNQPPSRTWGPAQFLAWFEEAARECGDYAEFVQLMKDEADDLDRMRKGPMTDHRAKLEGIIAEANGRFGKLAAKPPVDDSGWPGPDPEEMKRQREAAAVA